MKLFDYRYIAAALLCVALAGCSVDEPITGIQQDSAPQMSEGTVQGELLVRFDSAVADVLEKAGLTKSTADRSGVLNVDQVLEIVGGYELERVFPYNSASEAKTREAGLHLWYVVRFSEEYSVADVAAGIYHIPRSFGKSDAGHRVRWAGRIYRNAYQYNHTHSNARTKSTYSN